MSYDKTILIDGEPANEEDFRKAAIEVGYPDGPIFLIEEARDVLADAGSEVLFVKELGKWDLADLLSRVAIRCDPESEDTESLLDRVLQLMEMGYRFCEPGDIDDIPQYKTSDFPDGVSEEVFSTEAEVTAFLKGLSYANDDVESGKPFVRGDTFVARVRAFD